MTQSPARATPREWLGLAVLALPALLVSIDVSVIFLALPQISRALDASSAQQLWIVDIYSFLLAGFMITMGNLGDRIGRRKLLMIGGTAFAVASILAAFAPTANVLIFARAILGIAGATLGPAMMALITNMFKDERQRGMAISIWFTCFMVGMTLGPLVAGLLLANFWWGSVFLIGVPVMAILLVAGPFLLPEYKDDHGGPLDLVSVALSLFGILPAIYGLKEIAKGETSLIAWAAIAIGIVFLIAFIIRQRRLTHPLLNLALFSNKGFAIAVSGMFLVTMTGAIMLFGTQYLQLVLGLSPFEAGLWTILSPAASVVGFMVSPVLARTIRPAHLITAGLLVAAIGMASLSLLTAGAGLPILVIGLMVFNAGCAPMVTLSAGIVMSSVQPEKAGAAAAVNETVSQFGFALGIAALGSLGTALYRSSLGINLPNDLPEAAKTAASDTLAGAVQAAATLPVAQGASVLDVARAAFVNSVHLVAWLEAGVLVLLALLIVTSLRHIAPLGAGQGQPATA